MATIGVFLRVAEELRDDVRAALGSLAGVEPFELEEAGQLGIVLEAEDLDAGHDRLMHEIRAVPGVLSAWPVYAHFDEAPDEREDRDGNDAT